MPLSGMLPPVIAQFDCSPAESFCAPDSAPPARHSIPQLWGVVLAGGWGVRLRPLTRVICGDDRPKQYVKITGSRSLLEQTLDRTALRVPGDRTVVVSLDSHANYLAVAMGGRNAKILLQPCDRGTAAGVLLPAHWIYARDPDATIAFFAADHLVVEETSFMDQVAEVGSFVEEQPHRIALLGAQATEPETEYGWIEPGPILGRLGAKPAWSVRRFVEKPSPELARACLAAGASWNTFVFVAKARALMDAGRDCLPAVHGALQRIMHASCRPARPEAIRRMCAEFPRADFSKDVLERVAPRLALSTLAGVTWSDWGSPTRVVTSLARLGIRPPWLDHLTEPLGVG
jgi:mannose-1-phosphate guanylyltransferase